MFILNIWKDKQVIKVSIITKANHHLGDEKNHDDGNEKSADIVIKSYHPIINTHKNCGHYEENG